MTLLCIPLFFGYVVVAYECYLIFYFRSKKFLAVKESIKGYIANCNELNDHIERLKLSYVDVRSTDQGTAKLLDSSLYNMKRSRWAEVQHGTRVQNCSALIVKSASDQPFKYLCKYFHVPADEDSLSKFESTLNDFAAAEQGKILLVKERNAVMEGISSCIPSLVIKFSKAKVIARLGFAEIDLSALYFPTYTFRYVSAGGNSSSNTIIKLDIDNLNQLVLYLSNLVKFRKSVAGQRTLMTSKLREQIKARDNFTCQICSLSARYERNLLLEIDHILPLARGGITSERNLQTLCWKCNRSKGVKMIVGNQVAFAS